MGTNYYAEVHSNEGVKQLHIGKQSCGWAFGLHVEKRIYDGTVPSNYDEWVKLLKSNNTRIYDEYGDNLTSTMMIDIINLKKYKPRTPESVKKNIENQDRYFNKNQSAYIDSIGLLRRTHEYCFVDGNLHKRFDYVLGEFS